MQAFADFSDSLLGGALLVGLSVALGSVAWALAVLRPWQERTPSSLVRRCVTLLAGGALGVAVCQSALLALKTTVLSTYLGEQAFAQFARTLQFRAGTTQVLLALGLAGAALSLRPAPRSRNRWALVTLLAFALPVSSAWLAHAVGRLEHRVPLMMLTVLHEIGAALWVGGILQLAAAWRVARRDADAAAVWPLLVRGFSRVAVTALVVLLLAAVPLAWLYVGSWDGLVGSGYGSLIATKGVLMTAALLLGALNFVAARRGGRDGGEAVLRTRVPYLVEAETILLVILLFAAAGLSSQPPSVDTTSEHASLPDVIEVFRPKWPALRTPSVETMVAQDAASAAALAGGERTREAYLWSNFSHNGAGLILLGTSVLGLVATRWPASWARHWSLGLVALAVFVLLRTSARDGAWPFGTASFWQSVWSDAQGLQHRLGACLAMAVGLLEWRARAGGWRNTRLPYLFPVLAATGGVLLLTHSHTAFEVKRYYLVQVTHTVMGALAVLMGCARLLELRLPSAVGRLAGTTSTVMMLLLALVLVFYREANVVIPPG